MDLLLTQLRLLTVTKEDAPEDGLAPKPTRPPRVFELHDIDYDFPTAQAVRIHPHPRCGPLAVRRDHRHRFRRRGSSLAPDVRDPEYEKHLGEAMKAVYENLPATTALPHWNATMVNAAGLPPLERLKSSLHTAKANDQVRAAALMSLYNKSPKYPRSQAFIDVGALLLRESIDLTAYHITLPDHDLPSGVRGADGKAKQEFLYAVETAALCEQAQNGALEWIKEFFRVNGFFYCRFNNRTDLVRGALVKAALNNHTAVVEQLLEFVTEKAKIEALVALTGAATASNSTDPFVATGRAIYRFLRNREPSFAEVQRKTMPDGTMRSAMISAFLQEISRS